MENNKVVVIGVLAIRAFLLYSASLSMDLDCLDQLAFIIINQTNDFKLVRSNKPEKNGDL